uniref:Uncharacterized protein n=1 Tax=Candidatus Kentrum sp. FW TaxID=2126338 RepID=A0A450TN21_9GAMM|nr:MAG: hypothetical protein BECKFW1821B_GA0114236_11603 [Candidatus Kentron sp. FW]
MERNATEGVPYRGKIFLIILSKIVWITDSQDFSLRSK